MSVELSEILRYLEYAEYEEPLNESLLPDALAALSVKLMLPDDVIYFCAGATYVSRWTKEKNKPIKIYGHTHKREVVYKLEQLVKWTVRKQKERITAKISVRVDPDVVYFQGYGLQFSYHNIQCTDEVRRFMSCPENQKIQWWGRKLQPIAGRVFEYAHGLRLEAHRKYWLASMANSQKNKQR